MLRAEEHVAARQYFAAVFDGREILFLRESAGASPVGNDFAMHAETRDAAVRINVQTQMCERERRVDREEIFAVAFER